LIYAYNRWKAEGTFPIIFHRCPDVALEEFLDACYLPTAETVGVFVGEEMVGVGWIVQAWRIDEMVVAEVGVAFFSGTPLTVWRKALWEFLKHAFVVRDFDQIYGMSAVGNRAARLITRWCGMKECARPAWIQEVPDSIVSTLDYETWMEGKHHAARAI
jgi:hypothetical protein